MLAPPDSASHFERAQASLQGPGGEGRVLECCVTSTAAVYTFEHEAGFQMPTFERFTLRRHARASTGELEGGEAVGEGGGGFDGASIAGGVREWK